MTRSTGWRKLSPSGCRRTRLTVSDGATAVIVTAESSDWGKNTRVWGPTGSTPHRGDEVMPRDTERCGLLAALQHHDGTAEQRAVQETGHLHRSPHPTRRRGAVTRSSRDATLPSKRRTQG